MPKGGPFVSDSIRILFFGGAQLWVDTDYVPATGTGEWEIKLNVSALQTAGKIVLTRVDICRTDTPGCSNIGSIFTNSPSFTLVTGVKTISGTGTLGADWASGDRLAYLYTFKNLDTVNTQWFDYTPDQAMMYPRFGHNQIGLGTGIMSRGDLSVAARQNKRHTLVSV